MQLIKDDVSVKGLQPEMLIAWNIADAVYTALGIPECILTSGTEGVHREGSLHYVGYGIDLRTRNFPVGGNNSVLVGTACDRIRERLGKQYDVIREHNHIHIEFDPK